MDAHPPLPPEIWGHTPPVAQEMIVAQAAMLAQLAGRSGALEGHGRGVGSAAGAPLAHLLPATLGGSAPDAAPAALRAEWPSSGRAARP